ncbi:MAG: ribosome maturation factor RimP [Ruminococcus sp.]|jgi:ribosome maturation factor RimP|nr:ribosome maturation factor RimP [Ruminococcus sp.]
MTLKKFNKTESTVHKLVLPIANDMNLSIWDIAFEKQGSEWFLTVLIDDNIDMNTCEELSRRISKMLDDTDPIPQSYMLEVGSAGLERDLLTEVHINAFVGKNVFVKLIRPMDGIKNGIKELTAVLKNFDGEKCEFENENKNENNVIEIKNISKIKSIMEENK